MENTGRNKSGLTPAVINSYLQKKDPDTGKYYTQAKIAEIHGVTPPTINWIKNRYGGVMKGPKRQIDEMWPWDVPARFERSSQRARLKDHLMYRAAPDEIEGWSKKRLSLLRGFYRRLIENDEVVEFDPNIPPHDGCFTGGWAYRPRTEDDGRLIIRVNEFTKELDERMKVVWRVPPKLP